jgi:hypothetical protein
MCPLWSKTLIATFILLFTELGSSGLIPPGDNSSPSQTAGVFAADAIDQVAAPAPVHKFAIIIGIVYNNLEFGAVNFADQDAGTVYNVLTRQLGFPAENVILLQNRQATRENIMRSLNWLVTNPDVDSTSEVVFFYSGHGVRNGPGVGMNIPDVPPGYALIPFDFYNYDFKKGAGLIWDWELANILSRINPGRMWISIDSCYSGGFVRPGITGPNRVVTTSSQGDEASNELADAQRGVFTKYIVDDGIARGLSVEEAYQAAYPRARAFSQTPQIADNYPGNTVLR